MISGWRALPPLWPGSSTTRLPGRGGGGAAGRAVEALTVRGAAAGVTRDGADAAGGAARCPAPSAHPGVRTRQTAKGSTALRRTTPILRQAPVGHVAGPDAGVTPD